MADSMNWKTTIEKHLGRNAMQYIFRHAQYKENAFIFHEQALYDAAYRQYRHDLARLFPDSLLICTVDQLAIQPEPVVKRRDWRFLTARSAK